LGSEVEGGHGGLAERDEGRPPDFEDLGLNRLWAEKGKEKEFPFFIFRKNFREKQNNLEIAR
jgi:hypothetical protein